MRAYDAAMSASWAMLPEAIEQILEIASRENDPTPEALDAYRAARADNGERLSIRGNVGILEAKGPLFKRANLMTAFSGATSYEVLRRDLQVATDDNSIDAIMLKVDSPGGEVSACDEFAAAIYEARSKKPIVAYVSGQGASAAYWLAAATDKIIVSDSAMVGSIGVVLGITSRKKADEKSGISRIEFVSSQSPDKRPDIETDEGKAKVQKIVDALGEVFVNAVAKYRGVTADHVLSNFGAGGIEVGASAVALGMADEVGQFEAALSRLSMRGKNRRYLSTTRSTGGFPMSTSETADIAKLTADAAAKAQKDERLRFSAINASEGAKILPLLAHAFIEAGTDAETAVGFLKIASAEATALVEAAASNAPEAPELTAAEKQKNLDDQKAAAGALGIGQPGSTESNPDASAAGWKKAAASANSRFGEAGTL